MERRFKNLKDFIINSTNCESNGIAEFVDPLIHSFKKLISAQGKNHFLMLHRSSGSFPKHLMDGLILLDNRFNNNFLKNSKNQNFFNNMAIKLLNLDIKQSHWLINFSDKEFNNKKLAIFDKFPNFKDNLAKRLDELKDQLIKEKRKLVESKFHKRLHYSINKPYGNLDNNSNKVSSITSNNLTQEISNDWINPFSLVNKYNSLHNEDFVINLTDTIIPKNILNLLSLGDNFNWKPFNYNKDILNIIAEHEDMLNNLNISDSHKNCVRNNIARKINVFLKNRNNHSNILIRTINKDIKDFLKFKRNNPLLYFIRSDKSKRLAIITKQTYFDKMAQLLDDKNVYRKERIQPEVMVNKIKAEVNKYVSKLHKYKFIDDKTKARLTTDTVQCPRIYGLIKIHKEGYPLRPIVNNIKGPTYKLSKFLKPFLDPLNNDNLYDIPNSFALKDKLASLRNLGPEFKMTSFDVKSLFTNVPLDLFYKLIKENWDSIEPHTTIKSRKIFLEGIQLICNNGFFSFDNCIYRQLNGFPMGGFLSVNGSGIVMNALIKSMLDKVKVYPKLIVKYVDDILMIVKEEEINLVLEAFNSYNKNLQFTVEHEQNGQIRFLETTLIKINNEITMRWSKKDTTSNRILSYISQHPKYQIKNILNNFIYKAIKLTDSIHLPTVKKEIFQIFETNLYPRSFINKCWNANMTKINTSPANRDLNPNTRFISQTYISGLSEQLKHTYQELQIDDYKIGYKATNKISNFYTPLKDKIPLIDQSDVVYKIDCLHCPKSYIGQTMKNLNTRIKRHQNDCKPYKNRSKGEKEAKTALAKHNKYLKHKFDFDNPKVLHSEKHYYKRLFLEALYITKHSNTVINDKQDMKGLSNFYAETLFLIES